MSLPQTATAPTDSGHLDPRRWASLILLSLANFMVILDSQVVILASPTIASSLHMTASSTQWVISANLITFGGLLLLGGRAADLFAGAAALAVAFLIIEIRSAHPLVPLRILRSASLLGGNLATVAIGMAVFGVSLCIAEYAQGGLGYSALQYGVKGSPLPVMALVSAFAGQRLISRVGPRVVAVTCVARLVAGSVLLVRAVAGGGSYGNIFIALFVFGTGLGLGTVACTAAALSGISRSDAGLASGFNAAAFQIGGSFGIAAVTTVIVSDSVGTSQAAAMTAGFKAGFVATAIFGAAAFVIALIIPAGVRTRPQWPAPPRKRRPCRPADELPGASTIIGRGLGARGRGTR